MEAVLEEVDTGDKGFSLDAVLVEVIRVTVGGCDKDNAVRHKGLKESEPFSEIQRERGIHTFVIS
jgi:hypothetical protein